MTSKRPLNDGGLRGKNLAEYTDLLKEIADAIRRGDAIIKPPPDDMIEKSSVDVLFALAADLARDETRLSERARSLRNKIAASARCALKNSNANLDVISIHALVHFSEKFARCFAAIEKGAPSQNDVIGAVESAFAIATLAPPNDGIRRQLINEGKRAGPRAAATAPRPRRVSKLTLWVWRRLERNEGISNNDLGVRLIREAKDGRSGGDFWLDDEIEPSTIIWEDDGGREHHQQITGLGSAISKAKKKFPPTHLR